MLTSSAKAKGRRLMAEVRDILIRRFGFSPDDITVTPSSLFGEDLLVAKAVRDILPLCWEGKNQEKMNIWDSLLQSQSHLKKDDTRKAILVFKRNRSDIYMSMKFEDFIDLIQKQNDTNQSNLSPVNNL